MGNTSEIYRKNGIIIREEVEKTLDEINKDLFDNKLPILHNDDGIMFINDESDLYWWFEDETHITYEYDDENDEEITIEDSENYIEYRDVPRLRASAWLQDVLTKELSDRLGLINFCPAIGEVISDSYAKSFEEYTKRMNSSLSNSKLKNFLMTTFIKGIYDRDSKIAKEIYPKDFYEYIFDKNFKFK